MHRLKTNDMYLLLMSEEFGNSRVVLGLQEPRRLAARLFKKICMQKCAGRTSVANLGDDRNSETQAET